MSMLSKWKPVDVIVLILTLTVCTALMGTMVVAVFNLSFISEDSKERINAVYAGLLAIISMWVGSHYNRKAVPAVPQRDETPSQK